MTTIKLQQRGTLTLPKKLRESLNLSEGSVLRISEDAGRIVLESAERPDAALLRDITQSLQDIKEGNSIVFSSIPEFKRKLKTYNAD